VSHYEARGQLVVARKGVVTIYAWKRRAFAPVHTLDFESLRPVTRR